MELTPNDKEEILLALMARIETIIATLEASRTGTNDDYWLPKLESCNNVYYKMMGANVPAYGRYMAKRETIKCYGGF